MSAGESPYVSMGNTPILANDPDGDIIKIEGNLFFRVKTRIVIAKMMSTEEGMRVVSSLQNDSKDWVIKNVEKKSDQTHHKDGVIYMNYSILKNNKGTYENPKKGQDAVSTMGHEMKHQEDFKDGTLSAKRSDYKATFDATKPNDFVIFTRPDGSTIPITLLTDKSEIDAMTTENKINAERGKPLRTYYGNQLQQILKDDKGLDGTDFSTIKESNNRFGKTVKNFFKTKKFEEGTKL